MASRESTVTVASTDSMQAQNGGKERPPTVFLNTIVGSMGSLSSTVQGLHRQRFFAQQFSIYMHKAGVLGLVSGLFTTSMGLRDSWLLL